jgi:HlyD family secretion protein
MKPALFFLAPAAVLGLAATSCRQESTPPFTFQTAPAQRGHIIQEVSASGSLSAVVRVDVGSQVSGKISALNADFNSRVKKDDVVAEIDSSLYTAILRQTEGELASARASATLKKQNLERKQILFPKQAATQFDLEEAVAELAQAEATVTIREAAVDRARIDHPNPVHHRPRHHKNAHQGVHFRVRHRNGQGRAIHQFHRRRLSRRSF